MAVQSLKNIARLSLTQWVISGDWDNDYVQSRHEQLLVQLDDGAWGDQSQAVLDRIVMYYSNKLTPRYFIAATVRFSVTFLYIYCILFFNVTLNYNNAQELQNRIILMSSLFIYLDQF